MVFTATTTISTVVVGLTLGGVLYWIHNVIYSLFFSPLRGIPSPLIFQIFPFYLDYHVAKGQVGALNHYYSNYGPIFRLGWNMVVVIDPGSIATIYGSYKFKKSSIYNALDFFGNNVFLIRDQEPHMKRKKLLMPAFSKVKVAKMEPTIIQHGLLPLLENLSRAQLSGTEIDIFHQFHYMSWDIVGELAFGESFGMLRSGDHPAVGWLEGVLSYSMLSYALPILKYIPSKSGINLTKFAEDMMSRYYKKRQDLIAQDMAIPSTIIENFVSSVDPETGERLSSKDILSEALVLLFGGTDTTSNSLSFFFYLLMKNPEAMAKVQEEIKVLGIPRDQIISYELCRAKLPYLEAAFKESMRLLPPFPGILFRDVPPGGATILGHHIPAGCSVGVPIMDTHRSPLLWNNPEEFNPDRWFDKDIDTRALLPFSVGPRGCIGRELAWLEMFVIASNILNRFQLDLVSPNVDLELVVKPILRPKSSKIMVHVSAPKI